MGGGFSDNNHFGFFEYRELIMIQIVLTFHREVVKRSRGSRSTVVAHWTAGHVEQLILHLGHDSYQIHLVSSGCL